MITKQFNVLVNILSVGLRYLIIFYTAILISQFVWWVLSPSMPDVYSEKVNASAYDASAKFILNSMPFGEVIVASNDVQKSIIASQMHLTGIYFNTLQDSMIFYELNHKSYVAKIGDKIGDSALIKRITPVSIILSEDNTETEILLHPDLTHPQPSANTNLSIVHPEDKANVVIESNLNNKVLLDQLRESNGQMNILNQDKQKIIDEFLNRQSNKPTN